LVLLLLVLSQWGGIWGGFSMGDWLDR
jgi:hypothetical protein